MLETKMARDEVTVDRFIRTLTDATAARAESEMVDLVAQKRKDHPEATGVAPWEHEQLEDRLKAERLGFDSQALRPYFEFSAVQRGVMEIMARIFGVSFKKISGEPVWHPDVETF